MVFTTAIQFIRSRGPDEFWRKRRIFKLAAHFRGRPRNCYSLAIRSVHRALAYATKGRLLKKEDMRELRETRLTAACEEHKIDYTLFRESLSRSNILLNRKVLADLAIWEPFTFKALTDVAIARAKNDGLADITVGPGIGDGIVTRGMLQSEPVE